MTHPYTDSTGTEWDLNDMATYTKSWFPNECVDLNADGMRDRVKNAIGSSLYYMICHRPGFWDGQYTRVVEFGKHFAREVREKDRWGNLPWLRKQLFLILDETENQC